MSHDPPLPRGPDMTSSDSEWLHQAPYEQGNSSSDTAPLGSGAMLMASGPTSTHLQWSTIMKRNLITSGLVGAVALALSSAAALAQPTNVGGPQPAPVSAASNPVLLVRGGGGHGFGGAHAGGGHGFGGSHGFHVGHFRRGFAFGGPYDYDNDDEPGCSWSARYHRWVCY
jgi:hypothetical protein